MDQNIYCEGDFAVVRNNNDPQYKGGIRFQDSTGHEYFGFYLYFDPDYNTKALIVDGAVDPDIQDIEFWAYNEFFQDKVPALTINGTGAITYGLLAFGYDPASTPVQIYYYNTTNTGDWRSLIQGEVAPYNDNGDIVACKPIYTIGVTTEETKCNSGFLGFDFKSDNSPTNELVLGYSDINGNRQYAQRIDMTGKTFLNNTLDVTGNCNLSTGSKYTINGVDIMSGVITDLTPITLDKNNNRVGINQVSPTYSLDVTGTAHTTGNLTVDSNLAVGGSIDLGDVNATLSIDTVNKRVGIVNASPAYPLDVTGDVNTTTKYKIGGTDVVSTSSGNVVLGGNNVYHTPIEDDLVATIVPRTGTATLGNINSTGVYGYQFSAAGTSEVSFIVQLSHKWQEGSDVTPHFHWCPSNTNTGNAVYKLDYWVVNMGEVISGVTTLTKTEAANGVAFKHQLTAFSAVTMSGKTASCMFGGRLYRDGNNASDTFTGDAFILGVDIHVKNNRFGFNT